VINITINGVEYQPVIRQKNSSRVAKIIKLYVEADKLSSGGTSLMIHGFNSKEFSKKDWDKDSSGGDNSFQHKRLSGLYCFTQDKYNGSK